jgi:hypothetical protein
MVKIKWCSFTMNRYLMIEFVNKDILISKKRTHWLSRVAYLNVM